MVFMTLPGHGLVWRQFRKKFLKKSSRANVLSQFAREGNHVRGTVLSGLWTCQLGKTETNGQENQALMFLDHISAAYLPRE